MFPLERLLFGLCSPLQGHALPPEKFAFTLKTLAFPLKVGVVRIKRVAFPLRCLCSLDRGLLSPLQSMRLKACVSIEKACVPFQKGCASLQKAYVPFKEACVSFARACVSWKRIANAYLLHGHKFFTGFCFLQVLYYQPANRECLCAPVGGGGRIICPAARLCFGYHIIYFTGIL